MKALFELFRRFDARRIFGFIRRLGGMSRPKVKCYDLRSTRALRVEGDADKVNHNISQQAISIHALRVEGDLTEYLDILEIKISIHALRVEGDPPHKNEWLDILLISIHALRVEGDCYPLKCELTFFDFYPRPPGGGRPAIL